MCIVLGNVGRSEDRFSEKSDFVRGRSGDESSLLSLGGGGAAAKDNNQKLAGTPYERQSTLSSMLFAWVPSFLFRL